MTNIKILEVNMSANKHSMFNAAFLSMIALMPSSNVISFFSEENHRKCVQHLIGKTSIIDQINFINIKIVDKGRFFLPVKFFFEVKNVFKVLLESRKEESLIILTSLSTLSNFLIKVIKIFFPKSKLIFVIHGELEFLKPQSSIVFKLWGWFLKNSFKIKTDKNTWYLVLGDVIKVNIEKYDIVDLNKIITIDHPCLYGLAKRRKTESNVLKIGAIGVASVQKNSQFIFMIADQLKEKKNSNVKLEIIGRILPNIKRYLKPGVEFSIDNKMMNQNTFEKKISELDFALFFYDNTFYELCASGAFFDALNHEIPILGLKNDFFEYYFNKYGALGRLFNNLEELIGYINNYSKTSNEEYNVFVQNIKRAKEDLSLEKLSLDFEHKLRKITF